MAAEYDPQTEAMTLSSALLLILSIVAVIALAAYVLILLRVHRFSSLLSDSSSLPPLYTLPNGLSVYGGRPVYREIFIARNYWLHGIRLDPCKASNVVFDVGANVGLYSVFCACLHSPDLCPAPTVPALPSSVPSASQSVHIFAFEPIPATFRLLRANVSRFSPRVVDHAVDGEVRAVLSSSSNSRSTVHVLPVGLGRAAGSATFRFCAEQTMTASMYPDATAAVGRHSGVRAWATALLLDGQRIGALPAFVSRAAVLALSVPVVAHVLLVLLAPFGLLLLLHCLLVLRLSQRSLASLPLTTLSEVMGKAHLDVECIDLLKIDVEGAEEEVWAGLAAKDRCRVRQLVVEVHDIDGRVERMRRDMEQSGFDVTRDQEEWATHKLLRIHTLFARRKSIDF